MEADTRARFAEIDALIDEQDAHLHVIAQQNVTLGEMVEVLGRYVNASIDHLQDHVRDPHAHGRLSEDD